MAINIPAGSGSFPRLASADDATPTFPAAGTLFIKLKPNWNSGDFQRHHIWNYGYSAAVTENCRFEDRDDSSIYVGLRSSANGDFRLIFSDAGIFSSGTWSDFLFDYNTGSGGDSHFYQNNSLLATGGVTPVLPDWASQSGDRLDFGNAVISTSYARGADGDFAEFARWDRVLTSTERAILAASFSPMFIPRGLLEYRPFIGHSFSRLNVTDGVDLTVNQLSVSYSQHPIVIYPSSVRRRVTTPAVILAAPPPIAGTGGNIFKIPAENWG